jgi:hypothetical protein
VTIRPILTAKHVTAVQVRCDIRSEAAQQALQGGSSVAAEQPGLFELKLNIGSTLQQSFNVPFPLKASAAKTRIARKQSWIEFISPVADMPFLAACPDNVFPLGMHGYESCSSSRDKTYTNVCDRQAPLLEHLAYVVPDTLPMLRIDTASWLATLTPYHATMSASEYKQYEKIRADSKLTMPGHLGVKESLHSMFMYTGGLCGLAKSTWFCLKSPAGVVCIMLVDSIRMDLSHQTVFLDAALFPPQANGGCAYLTPLMASLSYQARSNIRQRK